MELRVIVMVSVIGINFWVYHTRVKALKTEKTTPLRAKRNIPNIMDIIYYATLLGIALFNLLFAVGVYTVEATEWNI